ncbi:hypothetical protein TSUD_372300 [Trifolium subterraneum]|uniref:Reverse transcriptase zinc-binding domain-containing protein n=1 Tax=Trifolium subterraneum TaxID=3900 RepID=A0A2Z6MFN8_TRISU|nr:hypothetical protein TSUD_372300 [Trifolium subterraneum]
MLVDKGWMWYKVLASRYGEVAWKLAVGARRGSTWWREVSRIRDGDGVVRGSGLQRVLRDEWVAIPTLSSCRIRDSWIWRHDIGAKYSVRGVYSLLTTMDAVTTAGASELVWHKHVPLKVSALACRLLQNRLPTKDNLVERNIIPLEACFCVNECGEPETATHLFMFCLVF